MANGKSGNDDGNANKPVTGKKPTQDDLLKAASEATKAAGDLLEAVTSHPEEDDEDMPDIRALHGEQGRPQPPVTPPAFEEFMARLRTTMDKVKDRVRVTENAAWVKIEGLKNGHKIYVNKGKTMVSRVESTLPPSAVLGATEPGRPNGRIASWIPADPEAVASGIRVLATSDMTIRPPMRGRGVPPPRGGGSQGGPGGAGGGRRRGLLN